MSSWRRQRQAIGRVSILVMHIIWLLKQTTNLRYMLFTAGTTIIRSKVIPAILLHHVLHSLYLERVERPLNMTIILKQIDHYTVIRPFVYPETQRSHTARRDLPSLETWDVHDVVAVIKLLFLCSVDLTTNRTKQFIHRFPQYHSHQYFRTTSSRLLNHL
jgi:hypothetical protein